MPVIALVLPTIPNGISQYRCVVVETGGGWHQAGTAKTDITSTVHEFKPTYFKGQKDNNVKYECINPGSLHLSIICGSCLDCRRVYCRNETRRDSCSILITRRSTAIDSCSDESEWATKVRLLWSVVEYNERLRGRRRLRLAKQYGSY